MIKAVRLLACAACLRVALVLLGLGEYLAWRIEVSTPLNSLLNIRECVTLHRLQILPYSASSCRIPPLLVRLLSFTVDHEHAFVIPNLLCDLIGGCLLQSITAKLATRPGTQNVKGHLLSADGVMALFLFNPFTLASCISGSLSSLENLLILAAVHRGVARDVPGAAFAVAAAAYTGLHPLLLLVPVGLLTIVGPEDALGCGQGSINISDVCDVKQAPQDSKPGAQMNSRHGRALASSALLFLTWSIIWSAALMGISDVAMQRYPGTGCMEPAGRWLARSLGISLPVQQPAHSDDPEAVCWAQHVYRLHITVEDQTPNIGQVWYFFTELFPSYRPFFRFVIFSLSAMFVVPLCLRFPSRPLAVITAQALLICMFKPYPSVADHAVCLALLSLLQKQLGRLQIGMLLVNTFLLLAVLAPAMWHQWVVIESANSNFLYSITLLLGAWQTLVLVQTLLLTIGVERLEKGKGGKAA